MFAIGHDMYKGAVQEWLQRRLQQEAKENDSLLASYDKIVQDAKTTSLPQVSEQQEEEEETATVTDPELPELEEGEIDDHPIQ
jgi:bacterioferritin (cytochrome b1)